MVTCAKPDQCINNEKWYCLAGQKFRDNQTGNLELWEKETHRSCHLFSIVLSLKKKHALLIQSNLQSSSYLTLLPLKSMLKTKWWSGKVCFVISETKLIDKMSSGPIFIDCHQVQCSGAIWSCHGVADLVSPHVALRLRPLVGETGRGMRRRQGGVAAI